MLKISILFIFLNRNLKVYIGFINSKDRIQHRLWEVTKRASIRGQDYLFRGINQLSISFNEAKIQFIFLD